jgi:hypothetical protein
MSASHSTTLLELERADRFGPARSGGYVIWSKDQGEKIRAIQNESNQPDEELEAEPGDAEPVFDAEAKFNAS